MLFLPPPGWIFHFDFQLKAIVEAKQEGRMCKEDMGQNLEKRAIRIPGGRTAVLLQTLLLQLIMLLTVLPPEV